MKPIGSAGRRNNVHSGFALIEMLAALTIAATLFALIAQFTMQSVRNWNRGESTVATMEMLTRGLGRMGTDLALAVPLRPPGTDASSVLFSGDANGMLFVSATGFGAGNRGEELVSITVSRENDGIAVVRMRGPVATAQVQMQDPVVLLRGRMQVRFAYRGADGQLVPAWTEQAKLPAAVSVSICGATGLPVFPAPVLLQLPSNLSPTCLFGSGDENNSGKNPTPGCPQRQQTAANAADSGGGN